MLGQRNSLTPSSVAETTFSGCTVGLKFEINFLNSQKFIKNASEDNGGSNFVPSLHYLSAVSVSLTLLLFLFPLQISLFCLALTVSLIPSFSHNSLSPRLLNLYPWAYLESSFAAVEEQHHFQAPFEPPGSICFPLYQLKK